MSHLCEMRNGPVGMWKYLDFWTVAENQELQTSQILKRKRLNSVRNHKSARLEKCATGKWAGENLKIFARPWKPSNCRLLNFRNKRIEIVWALGLGPPSENMGEALALPASPASPIRPPTAPMSSYITYTRSPHGGGGGNTLCPPHKIH